MSHTTTEAELQLEAPDWNQLSAAYALSKANLASSTRVSIELSVGTLCIEIFAEGVRIFSEASRKQEYEILCNRPKAEKLRLIEREDAVLIQNDRLKLHVGLNPFTFRLCNTDDKTILQSPTDGHFVREHRIPPLSRNEQGWFFSVALDSAEPVYGLGEKWGALNKRGQLVRSFNHDALGVNAEISYKNTPFCWSPQGWGVFVHTPSAVTHAVGFAPWSNRSYCCLVEDPFLDVFLFAPAAGADSNPGAGLLGIYTQLTGRAPMPPYWSGGGILSKAYYKDADEILSAAKAVREQGLPCDVITFDGRAWQDTQTRFAFEWDASRYPDPRPVIQALKKLDFKICVWEYPLISVAHDWFEEFANKGWLLTDRRNGKAYRYSWDQQAFGKVLTPLPDSGIVDFTHPDAYAFWRDAHKPLFELGVDMIKVDFGEQLEDINMVAHNGENGLALHNAYALLYNRCVYEAAERYSPSGPFIFSRAAWTGSQRYNSQWGGDPQADWEGMMANIRGGLSWGLSGAPFYATDIGGFYKDTRNDALYVRWAQAGVFSAHFRLHGIGAREPWSYSAEAEQAVTKAVRLRYQLQHYLQKTMKVATQTGIPVQRPMVLAFPNEKQSWAFENQFMFGDDILVAPCFKETGEIEVYLPKGDWVRFDPDAEKPFVTLQGNQVHQFELALDDIPAFVRRSARIPLNRLAITTSAIPRDHDETFLVERVWPSE